MWCCLQIQRKVANKDPCYRLQEAGIHEAIMQAHGNLACSGTFDCCCTAAGNAMLATVTQQMLTSSLSLLILACLTVQQVFWLALRLGVLLQCWQAERGCGDIRCWQANGRCSHGNPAHMINDPPMPSFTSLWPPRDAASML